MTMVSQLVRPEAGILLHDQLSPSQIEAGKRALQLLQELCGATDAASLTAQRPHLDRLRRNRVVLIDGARGSGKTALLVTLLDALKKRCADRKEPWPPGLEKELSWEEPKKLVVPVDLIDLAPLPPTTNVLMHCVRRLDWVIRELEKNCGASSSSTAAAWHRGQAEDLPSRKAWKSLVRAITLGWDSRLSDRVERQDLESYARELEDAERQRDCLGELVSGLMKALTEDYHQSRSGQSLVEKDTELLFLFAIDDADMNPARTLELLQAVSLLHHPSLAFLLTGDSPLFELVLRRHYREQLCREQVQSSDESSRRYADRLALDVLDKLIPPGHRCELKPLAPKDRLEWRFQTLGQPEKRSLLDLMNEIKLDASSVAEQTLGMIFRETPQLAEVLPSHLRALVDFALFVEEKAKTTKESPLTSLVVELWERALRREGYGQNDSAWNWVSRSPDDKGLVIAIPGDDAGFAPKTRVVSRHETDSSAGWRIHGVTFTVQRLDGERGALRPIASALRMAVAIATSRAGDVRDSEPSSRIGFESLLAAGEVYPSGRGTELPLSFAWPLPAGVSFLEAAAFGTRWNPTGTGTTLSLAEEFLRRVAQYGLQLGDERAVPAEGSGALKDETESKALTPYQLVAQLAIARGGIPSRRYQSFFSWARDRAGLLAAPESGLSAEDANRLLTNLRVAVGDHEQWCLLRRRLRLGRRDRAAAAVNEAVALSDSHNKAEDIIVIIDRIFGAYDWKIEIEGGIGSSIKHGIEEHFTQLFMSTQTAQNLDFGSAGLARQLLITLQRHSRKSINLRKDFAAVMARSILSLDSIDAINVKETIYIKSRIEQSGLLRDDGLIMPPQPVITPEIAISSLLDRVLRGNLQTRKVHLDFDKRSRLMSGLHSLLWSIQQRIHGLSSERWLNGKVGEFWGVSLMYKSIEIPWPMPKWRSSFALEVFYDNWNNQTERWQNENDNISIGEVLLSYILTISASSRLVFDDESEQQISASVEKQIDAWFSATFFGNFHVMSSESTPIDVFVRSELPLIASLESGLPVIICNRICKIMANSETGMEACSPEIQRARLERLEVAAGSAEQAKELLAEFEEKGRKTNHPFQRMLDEWLKRAVEVNVPPPSDTK